MIEEKSIPEWVELGLTEKEYRDAIKTIAYFRWEQIFKAPYPYVLVETGFPYPAKKFKTMKGGYIGNTKTNKGSRRKLS